MNMRIYKHTCFLVTNLVEAQYSGHTGEDLVRQVQCCPLFACANIPHIGSP